MPSALTLYGGVHDLHAYMPSWSRSTSGFLGKSNLLVSIFQVPSKAFCAVASLGINNRAGSAAKKGLFHRKTLHGFELRAKLYGNRRFLDLRARYGYPAQNVERSW